MKEEYGKQVSITRVYRRARSIPQVRRRSEEHSFRSALYTSEARKSLSQEGRCEPEPTRAETEGQAFWKLVVQRRRVGLLNALKNAAPAADTIPVRKAINNFCPKSSCDCTRYTGAGAVLINTNSSPLGKRQSESNRGEYDTMGKLKYPSAVSTTVDSKPDGWSHRAFPFYHADLGFTFPRFCRLVFGGQHRFSGEFIVGQPFAGDLANSEVKALGIGHLAIVEAERLLVDIAEQMERFHADVGSVQSTLQETPEVFHPVSVDVSVCVLHGVIDDGVLIVALQSIVRKKFIGEDCATSFHVITNLFLKFFLLTVVYNEGPNVSAALHHAHNHSLVFAASAGDNSRLFRFVHVPSFSTDESFVNFDFTTELAALLALLSEPDSVKQKPSGFLGDAKRSRDLATADTVLSVQDHPGCSKPLIETDRTVFHDRANLDRELTFRMPIAALPAGLILEKADVGTPAGRANHAVLPLGATGDEVVKAVGRISEVKYRFLKSLGFVNGFHTSSLPQTAGLVNYIIALVLPIAIRSSGQCTRTDEACPGK